MVLHLNYIIVYFWMSYLSLGTASLLAVFFWNFFVESVTYISDSILFESQIEFLYEKKLKSISVKINLW